MAFGLAAGFDKFVHELLADSFPFFARRDIDRGFPCLAISGAFFPWMGIAISCDFSVCVEYEARVMRRDSVQPGLHFRKSEGSEVEGGCAMGNVEVIDVGYGLDVLWLYFPYHFLLQR